MRTEQNLLTVEQAAERLGLSTATVRKWILWRTLPYVKLGAAVRFEPAAIEQFIDKRRVAAVNAR